MVQICATGHLCVGLRGPSSHTAFCQVPNAHRSRSPAGSPRQAPSLGRGMSRGEGSGPRPCFWFVCSLESKAHFSVRGERVDVTGNGGGLSSKKNPFKRCVPETGRHNHRRPRSHVSRIPCWLRGSGRVERPLAGNPDSDPGLPRDVGHSGRGRGCGSCRTAGPTAWSRAEAAELWGPGRGSPPPPVGSSVGVLLETPLGPQGSLQGHKEPSPPSRLGKRLSHRRPSSEALQISPLEDIYVFP